MPDLTTVYVPHLPPRLLATAVLIIIPVAVIIVLVSVLRMKNRTKR